MKLVKSIILLFFYSPNASYLLIFISVNAMIRNIRIYKMQRWPHIQILPSTNYILFHIYLKIGMSHPKDVKNIRNGSAVSNKGYNCLNT
jgi:hypothetical protein